LSAATRVFGPLTDAALPARTRFRLRSGERVFAFLEADFLGVLRAMLPLYWVT